MTITTAPARSEYTANALQTIFNYTFKIFESTDLNVYVTPVGQVADDSSDLTVGYTVTGIGNEDGGTIILAAGTSQNELVTIVSNIPSSRTTDYQNNGDFRPDVVNADFDRVVSIAKKIEDNSDRALLLQQSQQGNKPLNLAKPEAGKALVWNNAETGTVNVGIASSDELLTFLRTVLVVVPGETDYLLSSPLTDQNIVVVDGDILPQTAYGTNGNGDLVLTEPLNTLGLMFEVWNRFVSTVDSLGDSSALVFDTATTITTGLTGTASAILTRGGITSTDTFGAVWTYAGFSDTGKAGTIEASTATAYDIKGRAYTLTGNKIRLESLSVPYTETSATVLTYIVDLRVNSFEVQVSPEYNLTQIDSRRNIHNNVKQWIIHRGLQDIAPENTMLAFSMAYNRMKGQNIAFECDVQITSDGIPVVYHDITLDTLTDGTGLIKNVTFAYLQTLKFNEMVGVFGEDLVHIPSFDEFMEYAAEVGVDVHPEIKEYRTIDDISLMIDIIQKYKMVAMTYIGSFRLEDVVKARDLDQQINIDYIKEVALTGTEISTLDDIGNITILGSVSYITNNPVDIAIIQSKGWDIVAWTIDRIETMIDVSKLGIQKIIVDRNLMPTGDMTTISSPCRLNRRPWGNIVSGGGTVVMTANPENNQSVGEVATCEVTAIGDDARVRLPFNISAGEIIKLTIFAANVGGHPDEATIDVDRPTSNRKNTLNINSTELKEYEISYQAPWNTSFAAYDGGFDLGVPNTRDAGAVFFNPMVSSNYSRMGGTRTVMMGCIVIAQGGIAGAHRLDTQTASINIDGEEINPAGDPTGIIIRPQKETQLSTNFGEQYPNAYIATVNTNQATTPWAFDCNARFSTGHIEVFARNMATGATINLATTTDEHRFYFKVEI